REAGRPARAAGHAGRTADQHEDRQGHRAHYSGGIPVACGRVDRVKPSQRNRIRPPTTATGQTRTSADLCGTTASPPEADFGGSLPDVAEVPGAVIMRPSKCWERTVGCKCHFTAGDGLQFFREFRWS